MIESGKMAKTVYFKETCTFLENFHTSGFPHFESHVPIMFQKTIFMEYCFHQPIENVGKSGIDGQSMYPKHVIESTERISTNKVFYNTSISNRPGSNGTNTCSIKITQK